MSKTRNHVIMSARYMGLKEFLLYILTYATVYTYVRIMHRMYFIHDYNVYMGIGVECKRLK